MIPDILFGPVNEGMTSNMPAAAVTIYPGIRSAATGYAVAYYTGQQTFRNVPGKSMFKNSEGGFNYHLPCYSEMFKELNTTGDGTGLAIPLNEQTSIKVGMEYCSGLATLTEDPIDNDSSYDLDINLSLSLLIRYNKD
jgi:hypothetical protein